LWIYLKSIGENNDFRAKKSVSNVGVELGSYKTLDVMTQVKALANYAITPNRLVKLKLP
jgi:hypothetical protein